MRVNEAKSVSEIAVELGRTWPAIDAVWRLRCIGMLPNEVLQRIHDRRSWSDKEEMRLLELLSAGLTATRDICVQFSSRTREAVYSKFYRVKRNLKTAETRRVLSQSPELQGTQGMVPVCAGIQLMVMAGRSWSHSDSKTDRQPLSFWALAITIQS